MECYGRWPKLLGTSNRSCNLKQLRWIRGGCRGSPQVGNFRTPVGKR